MFAWSASDIGASGAVLESCLGAAFGNFERADEPPRGRRRHARQQDWVMQ